MVQFWVATSDKQRWWVNQATMDAPGATQGRVTYTRIRYTPLDGGGDQSENT